MRDSTGEYQIFRDDGVFRIDHSIFLRHAITGVSANAMSAAERVGYVKSDFETRLFEKWDGDQTIIMSFGADYTQSLYTHRATGIVVPFTVNVPVRMSSDLRALSDSELPPDRQAWATAAFAYLRDEFDFIGVIQEKDFKDNLNLALTNIPRSARIFVLNFLEQMPPSPAQ